MFKRIVDPMDDNRFAYEYRSLCGTVFGDKVDFCVSLLEKPGTVEEVYSLRDELIDFCSLVETGVFVSEELLHVEIPLQYVESTVEKSPAQKMRQELMRGLSLKNYKIEEPIIFRYWYSDSSMNALIAPARIADLDDEVFELRLNRVNCVQSVQTGLNINKIQCPNWSTKEEECIGVLHQLIWDNQLCGDSFEDINTIFNYHIASDGTVTVSTDHYDSICLKECGDVETNEVELKEWIYDIQNIYGDFYPDVIREIVENFRTLLEENSLGDGYEDSTKVLRGSRERAIESDTTDWSETLDSDKE